MRKIILMVICFITLSGCGTSKIEVNQTVPSAEPHYTDFELDETRIKLIDHIPNIENIYCFTIVNTLSDLDINQENYIVNSAHYTYDLKVIYKDESELVVASYDNMSSAYDLDYRVFAYDQGKIYFLQARTPVYELEEAGDSQYLSVYEIDFNNLEEGPTLLEEVSKQICEDNAYYLENNTVKTYSTKIDVLDGVLYYHSFTNDVYGNELGDDIKSIDLESKEVKTIIQNVGWYEYQLDINSKKILYSPEGEYDKCYIADLSGNYENCVESDEIYMFRYNEHYLNGLPVLAASAKINGTDYREIYYILDAKNPTLKLAMTQEQLEIIDKGVIYILKYDGYKEKQDNEQPFYRYYLGN